jgi:hypothetical protein
VTGTAQTAKRPIGVRVFGTPGGLTGQLTKELEALRPGIEVSWRDALPPATLGTNLDAVPPDILIVLQQHPDHASPQQVRVLLNAFPLVRLIVCCSAWCESDGRSRDLWPAACRVPEHLLLHRLRRELASVRGDSPPLPLTADRDECWEYDFTADPTPLGRSLGVAVSTPDADVAEWVGAALSAVGCRHVDGCDESVDVLLFDADPWSAERAATLSAILTSYPELPIVALVGYPRAADEQVLLEAGARNVVAKLSPLSELCLALDEAAAHARRARRPALHLLTDT